MTDVLFFDFAELIIKETESFLTCKLVVKARLIKQRRHIKASSLIDVFNFRIISLLILF